uniref:Uncharacterized protein n=2 Tax=root TaxID=1 RepID=A0A8S5P0Q8_9CAUD|nr:MAG TPA: hypothetical protein [Peduovirinae sp. ctjOQ18]DAY61879.1 MAG TPA: hypothetical protein [Caudoviricetes sp.]
MDQKYIVIARRVLPMQVNGWGEGEIRLILSGKNFPAKITARIPHIRSANSQKITVKKRNRHADPSKLRIRNLKC